jgi:cytochrome c biogenesis protein CcmG/thiol:disulfide interchange protein DsbE
MTPRRTIAIAVCLMLVGLIAVGVTELPHGSPPEGVAGHLSAAQARTLLADSPPVLAALHAQSGILLDGGAPALRARLSALRGYPVVINKWASWCVPCREELGAFQRASAQYGRRVAFIGLDSQDPNRADALDFLRSFPVSYPSYYDKSGQLGVRFTDSSFTPVTVFIPPHGKPYIRQGQYPTVEKLEQDIQRYALNA